MRRAADQRQPRRQRRVELDPEYTMALVYYYTRQITLYPVDDVVEFAPFNIFLDAVAVPYY